jgi:hypothetical protein
MQTATGAGDEGIVRTVAASFYLCGRPAFPNAEDKYIQQVRAKAALQAQASLPSDGTAWPAEEADSDSEPSQSASDLQPAKLALKGDVHDQISALLARLRVRPS